MNKEIQYSPQNRELLLDKKRKETRRNENFEIPFRERLESEQEELFFKVDSLIAQLADIVSSERTLLDTDIKAKIEEAKQRLDLGTDNKDVETALALALAGFDQYAKRILDKLKSDNAGENNSEDTEVELELLKEELTNIFSERESKASQALEGTHLPKRVNGRVIHIKAKKVEQDNQPIALDLEQQAKDIKVELSQFFEIPGLKREYKRRNRLEKVNWKCVNKLDEVAAAIEEIDAQIQEIRLRSMNGNQGSVIGAERVSIHNLQQKRMELEGIIHTVEQSFDLGERIQRLAQLKKYQEAAGRDQMIEIPTIKDAVDNALDALNQRLPYMLAGHLGGGKTEALRHAARIYMIEQGVGYDADDPNIDFNKLYGQLEPEIFSGSDQASVYDLIGKLKLVGKAIGSPEDLVLQAKTLASKFREEGVDMPEEQVVKLLMGQGTVTETMFNYGPLGRALRDGKPIIIDEINMLPPEVITRINDLMLRPVGTKVRLQENGEEEFEIQPGFVILSTLNLGAQYGGIKDFNAAFGSRWVGKELDYPTVPETFDLAITPLLRKDALRFSQDFPSEEYSKLVDLSVAVREIQDLFSGKTEGQRFMNLATGVSAEKSQLKKVVISPRDLMRKIIQPWKDSNFVTPLDDIIAKNILAPASIHSRDDQKFMTEILLRRGFFAGWAQQDFAKFGIFEVSQQELDALSAAVETEEFKTSDQYIDILNQGKSSANLLKNSLMIGNIT